MKGLNVKHLAFFKIGKENSRKKSKGEICGVFSGEIIQLINDSAELYLFFHVVTLLSPIYLQKLY